MNSMRIAVFASGEGTLFETLVRARRDGKLASEFALLLSSSSRAGALQRAANLDVPSAVLRRSDYASDTEFTHAMLSLLNQHGVDFICLAGYLKLVPPGVVETYRHRMLNIHPALLPAFGGAGMYGRRVHEAVLAYGARITGATVHLVDEQYDHGPIVLQRAVGVGPGDTPETLSARVHSIEHDLYVDAVRLFEMGRIHLKGRLVEITGDEP